LNCHPNMLNGIFYWCHRMEAAKRRQSIARDVSPWEKVAIPRIAPTGRQKLLPPLRGFRGIHTLLPGTYVPGY
jgi:hypothetical protein